MQKEVLVLSALVMTETCMSCGGNQQQNKKEMKQEMTTESSDTILKKFTKENLYWIREPKRYSITDSVITIETEPNTDLWQRTYYGFSNDNAPVLQMKTARKYFSFTVKTSFNTSALFDQCGIAIYLDSDNWMNPEPIRALLNFNGYTEGWATYVEMMSYDMYKDYPDDSYADFERINSELNLLVSARVEIGVNYEGWDLEATQKYLSDNGFNSDGAESIMDYVIAEPVNYQMYVMGWQSFQELRDYAESALDNKFDEQAFHKVVLDAGPSQFYLIEKLVKQYVKDNL